MGRGRRDDEATDVGIDAAVLDQLVLQWIAEQPEHRRAIARGARLPLHTTTLLRARDDAARALIDGHRVELPVDAPCRCDCDGDRDEDGRCVHAWAAMLGLALLIRMSAVRADDAAA